MISWYVNQVNVNDGMYETLQILDGLLFEILLNSFRFIRDEVKL